MLQNMQNHYSAYEFDSFRLKLVVVAHAAGIKFFLADRTGTPWEQENIDPELHQRFVSLTKYGVEGYLCQITYSRLKIDPAKTRKDAFLKFVPSGVAAVAELQAKGFGYLKVG
jgi:intracellular sulfur oxidation DsrE/DsrF family protein